MIVTGGKELCGKVCHIPGLCYIATRFICVSGFPILPEESFLIIDGGDRTQGMKLPLHRGSVTMAYRQAVLSAVVLIAVIPGIFLFFMPIKDLETETPTIRGICCVITLVALGFFLLTSYFSRHSKQQARIVLARAGIDANLIDKLLSSPDLPSGEALAGFSPGQPHQTNVNGADQRLTSDRAPFSQSDDRSDRLSKDKHP